MTLVDDLTAFINARLDADEAAAQASEPRPWLHSPTARPAGWVYVESGRDAVHEVAQVRVATNAAHIARHDPARVLRDVEAKRRIITEHAPREVMVMSGDGTGTPGTYCGCCSPGDPNRRQRFPCTTLRILALPYADHPSFKEEWRP